MDMFPSLGPGSFELSYIDEEGDHCTVSSDPELLEAMLNHKVTTPQLFVQQIALGPDGAILEETLDRSNNPNNPNSSHILITHTSH